MDYREREYFLFDLSSIDYEDKKKKLNRIKSVKIRPNRFNTYHQEMISCKKEDAKVLLSLFISLGQWESQHIVQLNKDFCGQ